MRPALNSSAESSLAEALARSTRLVIPKPSRSQLTAGVFIALGLAVALGLVWAFGQQLALSQQMRIEERGLEQQVAAQQAHHDELAAQLDYVKSDEYAERWARVENKMARPGEVVIVPVAPANTAVPVQSAPTPMPAALTWWDRLLQFMLGPATSP